MKVTELLLLTLPVCMSIITDFYFCIQGFLFFKYLSQSKMSHRLTALSQHKVFYSFGSHHDVRLICEDSVFLGEFANCREWL